jgi:hypothetical protein
MDTQNSISNSNDNMLQSVQESQGPLTGKLLQRKGRRRNKRTELNGLIRAHDRLIEQAETRQIPEDSADKLSRMYGRQAVMIAERTKCDIERQKIEQVRQWQQQLQQPHQQMPGFDYQPDGAQPEAQQS